MEHYHPLLWITLIAVLAPLVNELPWRFRIPSIVLEIVLGYLAGPQVLGLIRADEVVRLFSRLGLCALFLMAGLEIDFRRLRGRPLRLACVGWGLSLVLAFAAANLLRTLGLPLSPQLVALALTTTAVGALLPILRDAGELTRDFGMLTLAAGAMGEFGPLLVLSLLPLQGHTTSWRALVVLGFIFVALLTTALVLRMRTPRLVHMLQRNFHRTSQLPIRCTLLLVGALTVLAIESGLEILIGAFTAGMIIGMFVRNLDAEAYHHKLDGIAFGFLIPIFFVVSGVRFDLRALLASSTALTCVPVFLVLFLVVRGLPVLLYRRLLDSRDQLSLAFYSAAALPLVVAITEVGVSSGEITHEMAAALVGAGMISLLVYPQVAMNLRAGRTIPDEVKLDEKKEEASGEAS
jgi:Kef-type K+ transport system membrane component KefB